VLSSQSAPRCYPAPPFNVGARAYDVNVVAGKGIVDVFDVGNIQGIGQLPALFGTVLRNIFFVGNGDYLAVRMRGKRRRVSFLMRSITPD
jgi:hypothetical protein